MTDPIDKVRKLIALAVGTSAPEEARTTALIACRLISEHKMLDAAPDPIFDWAAASERVRRNREQAPPPEPEPRYQRYNPRKPWNHTEHRRAEPPPGCAWIRAKFSARCLHCGKNVETGESVTWEKGCGVFHEACWPAAEAGSNGAPF